MNVNWDAFVYQLYQVQQFADRLVQDQLTHLSVMSVLLVGGAGLLTSLTPCMLSMLPLTVAYIGGSDQANQRAGWRQSLGFALGLASTLALLGVGAASLGKIYGQIGVGLPLVVSGVAILMGLNLLEIVPLRFPTLGATDWIRADFPPLVRAYLIGLTFGLIASPCSTPVLATLLAWVASTQDLLLGAILLLAYTLGYVIPLVIAGSFTATLKQWLALRSWSQWLTPISGAILLSFGVFSLLTRLPKTFL